MRAAHLAAALTGLLVGAILAGASACAQSIHVVTENTSYTFQNGDRVEGPATEVVEKTLQAAGLADYQIRIYPWARAYEMALHEPDVLIFLIARTAAREAQFKWAGEIMKIQFHLYRLRDRTDIAVKTLADAENYTIGVMRDDVRQQYLQARGFRRLTPSAQRLENFNKLVQRQVDLIPLSEDDAATMCVQAHFDCAALTRVLTLDEAATGLYMAFSGATADSTVQRVRLAFEKLKADGTVRRIMDKKTK